MIYLIDADHFDRLDPTTFAPTSGVSALSRALYRCHKRVYQDVKALMAVRLTDNDDGALHADDGEIGTTVKLGKAT